MTRRSYTAVVVQGHVHILQFPNRTRGWDVETVVATPADPPLARSTAISPTPVSNSNPMEGPKMRQEIISLTGNFVHRLSPNDDFPWDHSPALVTVADDDGDTVQINHVFVRHGNTAEARVWLTATGDDGQRVQVALGSAAMKALGELLLDEAEDAL